MKEYLSYAEIQYIANSSLNLNSWAERQQNIDMLVLHFACGIDIDELNKNGHDYYLDNGLIEKAYNGVKNIGLIEKAIAFEESPVRLLNKFGGQIQEFNDKTNEIMSHVSNKK